MTHHPEKFEDSLRSPQNFRIKTEIESDIADDKIYEDSSHSIVINEDSLASENPWPHLDKFVNFERSIGDNYVFHCKACLPKHHEVRAHKSSNNNVKSHFRKKHPSKYPKIEEACKAGSNRGKRRRFPPLGLPSEGPSIVNKNCTIQPCQTLNFNTSNASQNSVEKALVDLVIHGMYPLRIVDCPWFREFAKSLNPNQVIPSRRTLGRRIIACYEERKQKLISTLNDIQWVATTANCWTVANKGYLWMTVDWLEPETRKRNHGILACIRLKERSCYDTLIQAINRIHSEFGIERKVTLTTMDNGCNFGKTFVQFREERDLLPDIPSNSINEINVPQDTLLERLLSDDETDDDRAEINFVSVSDMADDAIESGTISSCHLKCGAHIWSLIVSEDSEKALKDDNFKKAYRAALTKAKALWNFYNLNPENTNIISAALGKKLTVPKDAKWKSMYDAIACLVNFIEESKDVLYSVMIQQCLNIFVNQDLDFITEYVRVMKPMATVFEMIQEDKNAYLGWLLPLFATTVIRLQGVKHKNLLYCSPLVDALLEGIQDRFEPMLENDECLLAAGFHPRFRLLWLEKYDGKKGKKEYAKKMMELKVEEYLNNEAKNYISHTEEADADNFMDVISTQEDALSKRSIRNKAQYLVRRWLDDTLVDSLHDSTFMHEKAFIDLFVRYNTAVPSSAAVEGLFSLGNDITKAKRSKLSDENLNILMFMRGNEHLSVKR